MHVGAPNLERGLGTMVPFGKVAALEVAVVVVEVQHVSHPSRSRTELLPPPQLLHHHPKERWRVPNA